MKTALFPLAMLFVFFFIFIRFISARSRQARDAQTARQASGKEHFLSGYSDEFVTLYKNFDDVSHRKPSAALRFIDKTISMAPPLNKQPLALCITIFFDQCCAQIPISHIPIIFSKISTISPALPFAMRNGETRAITNTFLRHIQNAIDAASDHVSRKGSPRMAQQTAHDVLSLVQLNHILINSTRTQFPTKTIRLLHEAMVCAFPTKWKGKDHTSLDALVAEASAFFAAKNVQGLANPAQSLDELLPLWKSQTNIDSQPSSPGNNRKYEDFESYLFSLRQRPMALSSEPEPMKEKKPALPSTTESKKHSAGSPRTWPRQHSPATVSEVKTPEVSLPTSDPRVPETLLSDTALVLPPLAEEQPHQSTQTRKKPASDTVQPLPPQPITKYSLPIATRDVASDQGAESEKADKSRPSYYTPPKIKSSYKRT